MIWFAQCREAVDEQPSECACIIDCLRSKALVAGRGIAIHFSLSFIVWKTLSTCFESLEFLVWLFNECAYELENNFQELNSSASKKQFSQIY